MVAKKKEWLLCGDCTEACTSPPVCPYFWGSSAPTDLHEGFRIYSQSGKARMGTVREIQFLGNFLRNQAEAQRDQRPIGAKDLGIPFLK